MYEKLVNMLIEKNKTVSIMESCTGGYISSLFHQERGNEKVLHFSCVPNTDEYKMKFGVKEALIRQYGVNSVEVAREMARCICSYTKSDFGIGITGTLNKNIPTEPVKTEDIVFISIYKRETNQVFVTSLKLVNADDVLKRKDIASFIRDTMYKLI